MMTENNKTEVESMYNLMFRSNRSIKETFS